MSQRTTVGRRQSPAFSRGWLRRAHALVRLQRRVGWLYEYTLMRLKCLLELVALLAWLLAAAVLPAEGYVTQL